MFFKKKKISIDFSENEKKIPCVLLLDVSDSMDGTAINELNYGLQLLKQELLEDVVARNRVEISIITFGGYSDLDPNSIEIVNEFETSYNWEVPTLESKGQTPLCKAVITATNYIKERLNHYERKNVNGYAPWLFLFTDGLPTDEEVLEDAKNAIINYQKTDGLFVPIAVGDKVDFSFLKNLNYMEPIRISEVDFTDFFKWLSRSLKTFSQSSEAGKNNFPKVEWGQYLDGTEISEDRYFNK